MKLFNRSDVIKFAIIIVGCIIVTLIATSCQSESGRRVKAMNHVIPTRVEHKPLWRCSMTFADSLSVESYTFAKDRYDAERTLTKDIPDSVYVTYTMDTVIIVTDVVEDRR